MLATFGFLAVAECWIADSEPKYVIYPGDDLANLYTPIAVPVPLAGQFLPTSPLDCVFVVKLQSYRIAVVGF